MTRSGPAATLMRVLGLRRSARLPAAMIRTRVAKRPLRQVAGALSQIYGKLGVRSRVELAALVAGTPR